MNTGALAFYMGYAFCQSVNVQHVIEEDALMVPFVVYWKDSTPTAIPYPGKTQQDAVNSAIAARESNPNAYTGWSFGRDGAVTLSNGTKHDVLLIEGSVPGLKKPANMFYLYQRKPFTLVSYFNWQDNPEIRRTPDERKEFMVSFKQGINAHPFGVKCLKDIENTKPLQ